MSRRTVSSLLFAAMLLATTAFVAASDAVVPLEQALHWYADPDGGAAYAFAQAAHFTRPITVEAHVQWSDRLGQPVVWLAGLAKEKAGPFDALAFRWTASTRGWFPAWKLELASREGLLPAAFIDRADGDLAVIELADVRPQAGHLYRAAMAYDPEELILSVFLEDKTLGEVIYAAHLPIDKPQGRFYPGAGWQAEAAAPPPPRESLRAVDALEALATLSSPVALTEVAVTAGAPRLGLPLALKREFKSSLLEVAQDGNKSRKLGIEYLQGEAVGLRLEWPSQPVDGEVQVWAAPADPGADPPGQGDRRLLTTLEWQAGVQDLVFAPGDLPTGELFLILEHVLGDVREEIQRHTLRVIHTKVQVSYTLLGRDYDKGALLGEVVLRPEVGVVEGAELVVEAVYTPAGVNLVAPQAPVELVRRAIDRLDQVVTIPFELKVPLGPGTLSLKASLEPSDAVLVGGNRQFLVKGVDDMPKEPELFPFVVNPWRESPDNITNVSHWLEKPAGKDGFISVQGDRFVTGSGEPIRFLGVNCAFAGCFPDHASAEKIARQLARFGINLVRFHHMDMQEAPGGIWQPGVYPRRLDPRQLDRLDYFIYQLKLNGIYSNLNLHVSRTMTPQEGYPEPEKRPDFDKGLSYYDRGIIEHQKAYARELLTHTNPYTGNRYIEEPAIAMIEITNENGLILFTGWGQVDAMPQRYLEQLDAKWQEWLAEKYGTTEALVAAWGGGDRSIGPELAANGSLKQGTRNWALETDELSQGASMRVVEGAGPLLPSGAGTAGEPLPALEVRVAQKGAVSWRPQFHHVDLKLEPGKSYLVSFWIKADRPRSLTANVMMNHDPWTGFGSIQLTASTQWEPKEFAVRVPTDAPVQSGRVGFTELEAGATYWIAGVSVREVVDGGIGLPPGERLETRVSRPLWAQLPTRTEKVQEDYIAFLWDVEKAYFDEMYRYIKEELGARPPVTGTQVPWSPPGILAALDYVDAHAYWQHPEFPGAAWDASNWLVRNTSMTTAADGGTIASLAATRVAGKPYVVSEYNHPAPNTFSSEGFLLAGAYGAFQDWDGLIAFAWSHDANFWPQRIPSFFDIKSHPTKLVTLPAVAAMLLRGDVRPAEKVVLAQVDDATQRRRLLETGAFGIGTADGGVPPALALQHRIAMVVDALPEGQAAVSGERLPAPVAAPQEPIVVSDTGELRWERPASGRGVVVVDTPLSKAVIGYGGGRAFELSDGVIIAPGPTRQDGWSTLTLTVMDGDGFTGPARILVTATGYVENTGMGWESRDEYVTVRQRWGDEPSLAEGVPARIELPVAPARVTAYALDGAGDRREPVAVAPHPDDPHRAVLEIGPAYRTLWYEIEIGS